MFHVPGPALRANLAHSELIPVQKNRAKIPSLESSDGLHVRLPMAPPVVTIQKRLPAILFKETFLKLPRNRDPGI